MTMINWAWYTGETDMASSISIRKLSMEEMLNEEAKEERMA